MPTIILASASPSRKKLLDNAGIFSTVMVSGIDEDEDAYAKLSPKDMVLALAIVKAHTVRERVTEPALIIACDSTFEFEGISLGKPITSQRAISQARQISGKSGYLHTGHCIIDTDKEIEISDIASTKVTFSVFSDTEIADYVASGEPLNVAGGFTLDGLGSAFISSIEGDYSNVIGLSIPLVRAMTTKLGYSWPELKKQSARVGA